MKKYRKKAGMRMMAAMICMCMLTGGFCIGAVVTAYAAGQEECRYTGRSPTEEGTESESVTMEESRAETESMTEGEDKPETETGTENESEQGDVDEPEAESGTETEAEPKTETGTEAETESKTETGTEAETEPEAEPETETETWDPVESETETGSLSRETEVLSLETESAQENSVETTEDTYLKNGGKYELPYILGTFNAFVSGDYYGTHVVGPMIVGGNTQLNGSLGGNTQEGVGNGSTYRHASPSYLRKKAWNRDSEGHKNIPRIMTGNPDINVYLGMENAEQNAGSTEIGTDCRKILFTDSYLDDGLDGGFSKEAFQKKLEAAGEPWMEFEGYDGAGHKVEIVGITQKDLDGAPEGTLTSGGVSGKGYRLYREGGKIMAELNAGGNYRFETFDGIDSIYYRYRDAEEMESTITIIRTQQSGDVFLPKILKTVKDDVYGNDYQFSSVENGPKFTVLYFAPDAERIFVGCERCSAAERTSTAFEWKPEQAADVRPTGGKLVGHLWTPGADVVLRGGDYSGCVVADDVDAAGSGAEGHMWPFEKPEFEGNIRLAVQKTVDGRRPCTTERFCFRADIYQVQEFPEQQGRLPEEEPFAGVTAYNDPEVSGREGLVDFGEIRILEPGKYLIRIREEMDEGQQQFYEQNDTEYEVRVELEKDGSRLNIRSLKWYKKENGSGLWQDLGNAAPSDCVFDNIPKRDARMLTVRKRWQDGKGEPLEQEDLPPVKIFLYRTTDVPEGVPVKLELYSGMHQDFAQAVKVAEINLGYAGERPVLFRAGCLDRQKERPESYSAGICETGFCVDDPQNASLTVKTRGPQGGLQGTNAWMEFELTARKACTVKVLLTHTAYNYSNGTTIPEEETLIAGTLGEGWNEADFSDAEKVTDEQGAAVFAELNADNGWTETFYGLPEKDADGKPYFYKIAEEPVPDGFEVSYIGPVTSGEGEAAAVNRAADRSGTPELPKTGGNPPECLEAAGGMLAAASAALSKRWMPCRGYGRKRRKKPGERVKK